MGITMKTNDGWGGVVVRGAVLLSVLLLSACASFRQASGETAVVQENRPSDAAPQPAVRPRTDPVETQQQPPIDQPPKKSGHNVEED